MAITVGDIYTAFPTFKPKDMIDLMGTDKFNGRSKVSLSKIARYKGGMAEELSVFTAKREGTSYTNMLSQTERQNVSEKANISAGDSKPQQKPLPQNIPMDTSIFDVNKQSLA